MMRRKGKKKRHRFEIRKTIAEEQENRHIIEVGAVRSHYSFDTHDLQKWQEKMRGTASQTHKEKKRKKDNNKHFRVESDDQT
jgi:hypothetical protein